MKRYFCLVIVCCLNSCDQPVLVESVYDLDDAQYSNLISLQVIETKTLQLDSVTSAITASIQYLNQDGQELLAYWNNNDKSIIFFDLEYEAAIHKQSFVNTGPNAVYATNFLIHNEDSIFMTDAVQSTYLVDNQSEVLNRFPVEDTNELDKSPGPYVWTGSPLTFSDGELFFQGYIGGIFDQPNMGKLNLESKEIDYFAGYPDFYTKGYWRGGFEYMHYTFNASKKMFVYSYVADHYVRTQSLNDLSSIDSSFAGSLDFGFLKPPREKMGDPGGDLDEQKFKLQPSFGMIHYDEFNDLYYRFAYEAITESDLYSGDVKRSTKKRPRIIILNSELEKVGEVKLPRFKYSLNMSFVGKRGLYLKVINDDNEDILEFDVFSPVKL